MVDSACFGITLPSSGRVSGAFWEMLNWEAVTRHNTPIHNILSTASQLSISQKALETLPDDGYVMPKYAEVTIHNYYTGLINGVFVGFPRIFLLGILIFKGLTADVFISGSVLNS